MIYLNIYVFIFISWRWRWVKRIVRITIEHCIPTLAHIISSYTIQYLSRPTMVNIRGAIMPTLGTVDGIIGIQSSCISAFNPDQWTNTHTQIKILPSFPSLLLIILKMVFAGLMI